MTANGSVLHCYAMIISVQKAFLRGEQVLLLLRKFYWKIGRKLIISYSNKMQPLLAKYLLQKRNRLISAGSLKKREPSKKHAKTI